MRRWIAVGCSVTAVMASGVAVIGAERPVGYLSPGEFDVTHVLEPAPRKGDPRYETDRKIFRATRRLAGSPRWKLATADAVESPRALLVDFSCAVGTVLTPENAPSLTRVLRRAAVDTAMQSRQAKEVYRRSRPYLIDRGPICQPASELYDRAAGRPSYDYPSGHTTYGWTVALVLAAAAPDRAQRILERGRAYGDSRFICGAHNESAVEAGMLSASATMALVSTKPAYQADLASARAEVVALRTGGTSPAGCDAEAALLRQRVMPKLDAAK